MSTISLLPRITILSSLTLFMNLLFLAHLNSCFQYVDHYDTWLRGQSKIRNQFHAECCFLREDSFVRIRLRTKPSLPVLHFSLKSVLLHAHFSCCCKFSLCLEYFKKWALKRGSFMDTIKYLNFLSEKFRATVSHHPSFQVWKVFSPSFCSTFQRCGWGMRDLSQPQNDICSCMSLSCADDELRLLITLITARYLLDSILKGEEWHQFSRGKYPPQIIKVKFKSLAFVNKRHKDAKIWLGNSSYLLVY